MSSFRDKFFFARNRQRNKAEQGLVQSMIGRASEDPCPRRATVSTCAALSSPRRKLRPRVACRPRSSTTRPPTAPCVSNFPLPVFTCTCARSQIARESMRLRVCQWATDRQSRMQPCSGRSKGRLRSAPARFDTERSSAWSTTSLARSRSRTEPRWSWKEGTSGALPLRDTARRACAGVWRSCACGV